MYHTHSPSEWAAFISLGTSFWAACAAAVWLFADADLADFDPRPLVRRAHQGLVYAGHDLNRAIAAAQHELAPAAAVVLHALFVCRELARDVAALLLLLTTTPKGALR